MINTKQFVNRIIRPTLKQIGMYSESAERLLLGTALVESRLTYIAQLGNGPAMGFYQMEPATHDSIHGDYLAYHPDLLATINSMVSPQGNKVDLLYTDLKYQTIMCRLKYWQVPHALPHKTDAEGLANYWKKYYNTRLGKGDPSDFEALLTLEINQGVFNYE